MRTPLTAIKGFHELLSETALAAEPDAHLYLETMGNAIRRVNKLISELLNISRIESGKLELEFSKQSLRSVAKEAIDDLGDHADRDRIIQVIENLTSNAAKFSAPDSPIEIEIGVEGGWGTVSVRDYGAGISEEERDRVFDRYFRSDATHSVDGLGLGLYITRQITELHGGRLEVESELGSGSTFTLLIPLAHDV